MGARQSKALGALGAPPSSLESDPRNLLYELSQFWFLKGSPSTTVRTLCALGAARGGDIASGEKDPATQYRAPLAEVGAGRRVEQSSGAVQCTAVTIAWERERERASKR